MPTYNKNKALANARKAKANSGARMKSNRNQAEINALFRLVNNENKQRRSKRLNIAIPLGRRLFPNSVANRNALQREMYTNSKNEKSFMIGTKIFRLKSNGLTVINFSTGKLENLKI